jgi:hypothetical protein
LRIERKGQRAIELIPKPDHSLSTDSKPSRSAPGGQAAASRVTSDTSAGAFQLRSSAAAMMR